MENSNIPFPERLVTWYDLAKGVGEVILHEVFRMPHQLSSHGEHFLTDAVDDESPGA